MKKESKAYKENECDKMKEEKLNRKIERNTVKQFLLLLGYQCRSIMIFIVFFTWRHSDWGKVSSTRKWSHFPTACEFQVNANVFFLHGVNENVFTISETSPHHRRVKLIPREIPMKISRARIENPGAPQPESAWLVVMSATSTARPFLSVQLATFGQCATWPTVRSVRRL